MDGTRKKGWFHYLTNFTHMRKSSTRRIHPEYDFKAAGAVFTNGIYLLAAQQPNKDPPTISGIGGKREAGETPMYTAIRETLEELFEYKDVPKALINIIIGSVSPKKIIKNGSYVFGIYDFKDLDKILKIVKKYKLKSPLYRQFPDNITDLIFTRIMKPSAELCQLTLLPLVHQLNIDKNLLEDIPQIIEALK